MKVTSFFKNIFLLSVVFFGGLLCGMEGGEDKKLPPAVIDVLKTAAYLMLCGTAEDVKKASDVLEYKLYPIIKVIELCKIVRFLDSTEDDQDNIKRYKQQAIELIRDNVNLDINMAPFGKLLSWTIHFLYNHCDSAVDSTDTNYTALSEIVNEMIKYSSDLEAIDENGDTPLIIAVANDRFENIELLLNYKVNINVKNKIGQTVLHTALIRSEPAALRLIKLLLDRGADPTIQDNNGETAREIALRIGYTEAANRLAEHEKEWAQEQVPVRKKQRLSKEEEIKK